MKKQHIVSGSSVEVEYHPMTMTTCELKCLKWILSSLGMTDTTSMLLQCDSQAAIHISQNPVFHDRTKHIEVDCHFVHDGFFQGGIHPNFVSTNEQLVEIFTKALVKQQLFHTLQAGHSRSLIEVVSDQINAIKYSTRK